VGAASAVVVERDCKKGGAINLGAVATRRRKHELELGRLHHVNEAELQKASAAVQVVTGDRLIGGLWHRPSSAAVHVDLWPE
jgi:hypothetical protein